MTQKTLLALGGSRLLMPVINAAHELGHKVITCDYLPNNYAHKHSDGYQNATIVDHKAVTKAAHDTRADGIISFGADPGVVSAAYAIEQLGLPRQVTVEAARTLQSKHQFRNFLTRNGFPSPQTWIVKSPSQIDTINDDITYPVIVKPTDAAGSKGVTRVDRASELSVAVSYALEYSMSSHCVIETYIESDQPQRSAEGFAVEGKFIAVHFMDQIFNLSGPNPFAPTGNILPSTLDKNTLSRILMDLQRVSDILDFGTGIFNIEVRVATDGTPYFIEISPRGGGNRLAEFIRAATGQDLIRATVQAAIGDPITPLDTPTPSPSGVWAQEMLYSNTEGTFRKIEIDTVNDRSISRSVELWVQPGTPVSRFTHASFAIGSIFTQFSSRRDALDALQTACRVIVEPYH